jgi:hypothetical protein
MKARLTSAIAAAVLAIPIASDHHGNSEELTVIHAYAVR